VRRPLRRLLFLILVFVILTQTGFCTAVAQKLGLQKTAESTAEATVDPVPLNTYTWSSLSGENGRYSYRDGIYTSLFGIDVSAHQGTVDWAAVKADGVQFAMIRAGYRGYESGQIHEDDCFRANMDGASQAGLPVGVYYFSQAVTAEEAQEDAQWVLNEIQSWPVAYPVVFDMEAVSDHDRIADLTIEEKTQIAAAFCAVIREAGYVPMIYGSASWLHNDIHMEQAGDGVQFWVASYQQADPQFRYEFTMWQYSSEGSVKGIDGNVDFNLWLEKIQK
jgi:lysozyme